MLKEIIVIYCNTLNSERVATICLVYSHLLNNFSISSPNFTLNKRREINLTLNFFIFSIEFNLLYTLSLSGVLPCQITENLEQRCYKDLRNESFGSVKVILCIYRKLLSSCREQM
jgi:hypothetical protein